MKLKPLMEGIEIFEYAGPLGGGIDVSGISSDSRSLTPGDVFVAVRGALSDGHRYIQDALSRCPAAVIVENPAVMDRACRVPFILVKDSHAALCQLCDFFYGFPYQRIKAIGITGTNGKTTVSYLIKSILKEAGIKSGLIGTIAYAVEEGKAFDSVNTTPGVVELHRLLKEMVDAGDEYVVMEVSSHALDQGRIDGMAFQAAIFTNLTEEHLDYHKSVGDYFKAKQKLFKEYAGLHAAFIVNRDDPYGAVLFDSLDGRKFSYGLSSEADVRAVSFQFVSRFSRMIVQTPFGGLEIETKLVGRHNLYNILAAITWGVMEGLELSSIKNGIENLSFVPGRLDRIDSKRGFSVFIDYAHTDDALKNVLESLRESLHNGRIITVFGCGGNRDKAKRPRMGKVAVLLSDYVIVTSDNPRSEDARVIVNEIVCGLDMEKIAIELDRLEAIKKSLFAARDNDVVLIAGKGHEAYQIIGDKVIPFNDKTVVENILREMERDVEP